MWTPARDSTPRAGIVHPFASTSLAVRVNGPTSSSVARSRCLPIFRPTREARSEMRTTDECQSHADFREPVASLGYRPHRACALAAGAWCVSRRSTRFGDPLALPAVGVIPPHRGVISKIGFSSGSPLTPPSPHRLSRHARATTRSSSAEIAFPALPVKRERLPRPEVPSIDSMPENPRHPYR